MVVVEVDPPAGQEQPHPRISVGLPNHVPCDLEEFRVPARRQTYSVELVDHEHAFSLAGNGRQHARWRTRQSDLLPNPFGERGWRQTVDTESEQWNAPLLQSLYHLQHSAALAHARFAG
jgi:hypothetical protein